MVQQRQRSPRKDGDPAVSRPIQMRHRGPWALGHWTEARAGLLEEGGIAEFQVAPQLFTLPARTEQNDLLREVQILTLRQAPLFSL